MVEGDKDNKGGEKSSGTDNVLAPERIEGFPARTIVPFFTGHGRMDDYYDEDFDHGSNDDYGFGSPESEKDYTACSASDCGYCGHCDY